MMVEQNGAKQLYKAVALLNFLDFLDKQERALLDP